jgi:glycosyltransferase involved in cell wall biosynthesis
VLEDSRGSGVREHEVSRIVRAKRELLADVVGTLRSMPDVVLPALNEAAAVPAVIGGLPPGYEPIVVDNGSNDGTADVARAHGARLVVEPRRGFGAACFAGLTASTADVVCFMDCDGSFDGADLPIVANPVIAGDADLVLGARRADPGAWPLHARAGNALLAWELRRRTALPLRDLGPMRAARREHLLALGLVDRRFGWPLEMVLRSWQAQWRIREVEVRYAPRIGRSKVTGTIGGTARAVRDMARLLR